MNKLSRAAYIMAQTVNALAEIEGMKAANSQAAAKGKPEPYDELHFQQVAVRNQIEPGNVVDYLMGGKCRQK